LLHEQSYLPHAKSLRSLPRFDCEGKKATRKILLGFSLVTY
jgi:hypothetical protein